MLCDCSLKVQYTRRTALSRRARLNESRAFQSKAGCSDKSSGYKPAAFGTTGRVAEKHPGPQTYAALLASIKDRIQTAQIRAALAVNRELVLLYWGIGKEILARQQEEGWGTKVIERLAKDLCSGFPTMRGFSRTTSCICVRFQKLGQKKQLSSSLLDNCPGSTTAPSLTS